MQIYENLDQVDNFLEKYNSPKLTPEEVEKWNRLISIGKNKILRTYHHTHKSTKSRYFYEEILSNITREDIQQYSVKYLTTGSLWTHTHNTCKTNTSPPTMCGVCQFLWHEYFHHDWFQATYVMLLHVDLGRDVHSLFLWVIASWFLYTTVMIPNLFKLLQSTDK